MMATIGYMCPVASTPSVTRRYTRIILLCISKGVEK